MHIERAVPPPIRSTPRIRPALRTIPPRRTAARAIALLAAAGLLAGGAVATAEEVELPGTPTTQPGAEPQGTAASTTTYRRVPLRTLRIGSRSPYVEDLQRQLRRRGIRVKVDGVYGRGTRRGVRIVQKRLKLRATGVATTGLQRRMGIRPRKVPVKVAPVGLSLAPGGPLNLARPVGGTVTSGFGPRGGRIHEGIDIPGEHATPIAAAAAGKVIRAAPYYGYGNMVVIDHGNRIRTAYAHLSSIAVERGQLVPQGTVVGGMGSTGRSSAIHLHFEVRIKGRAVNPIPYL